MRTDDCREGRHRDCPEVVELRSESRTRPCSCTCHRDVAGAAARNARIDPEQVEIVRRRSGGKCETPDVILLLAPGTIAALDDEEKELIAMDLLAGCERIGVLRHHIAPRGARGRDDSAENLLDLCRPCHTWIHGHPELARRLGVLA